MFGFIKEMFGSPEERIKYFVKGACNAMVFSSNTFKIYLEKNGTPAKYYSDLASEALTSRSGWKKMETYLHITVALLLK